MSDDYGLAHVSPDTPIPAPPLDYQPHAPRAYRPRIGLIGCGGISAHHLSAYRGAGYEVAALCDTNISRARERQARFYPEAALTDDHRALLRRDDIDVVDIATHPAERLPLIEAALRARKHVLSQKPFVLDLDAGERLADLADQQGVRLAVNQNGRWAPHFAWLRAALRAGLIGDLASAAFSVHWDHSWVIDTPFNNIHDLVLYDFAIHWFDIVTCFFGAAQPERVFASTTRAGAQRAKPPLLAHALVDYPGAQASLVFDATTVYGQQDRTLLAGTLGSVLSCGPSLSEQTVTLHTARGTATPALEGTWFPDGFRGSMGELLCAIEDNRAPDNNARDNLRSLALAFAAIQSAHTGTVCTPGTVRRLPE